VADGLAALSLEEAFAQSLAEGDETASPEVKPAQSSGETEAKETEETTPQAPAEQPEADADNGELAKAMLDVVEGSENPSSESGIVPGSEEDMARTIKYDTVDGPQTSTLKELIEGRMMRADYTRKTQTLAEDRKALAEAESWYQKFRTDPSGFARGLAIEAGWLKPEDGPVTDKKFASIPSQEDFNELINQRVEEQMKVDPRIEGFQQYEQQRLVDEAFGALETKVGMEIPLELRQSLVEEAVARGTADLELVFQARLARVQDKQLKASGRRKGATSRPGSSHQASTDPVDVPDPVTSIEDAYKQAVAQHQAQ